MDLYRNDEFIFNSPFVFRERFADEEGYFSGPGKRYEIRNVATWDTNFIADVSSAAIDTCEEKGVGALITCFEIAGNSLVGHLSQWPAGLYHKAHYHGPGSVLFGLQSNGYVLLWSKDLGTRPYESGNGDGVVEMNWKDGSVYCPPGGWFHQHFNIGSEPARQLAIRFGGRVHPTGFATAAVPAKHAAPAAVDTRVVFKLGQWLDVGLWEKSLAPRRAEPAEPLPFAGLT